MELSLDKDSDKRNLESRSAVNFLKLTSNLDSQYGISNKIFMYIYISNTAFRRTKPTSMF